MLRGWTDHAPAPGRTRLTLRFFARPVRILGEDRVTGVEVERTAVDGDGRAVGTGELEVLPADLVIRSVGYRGTPLPGLPVDERSGTIANEAGRVLRDGAVSAGEYVAGWIKRGPSGVVGTNKHDARETVASLLADVAEGRLRTGGPVGDLVQELIDRGCRARPARRLAGHRRRRGGARARPAAGHGRRCTSGRPCWPPSVRPPPAPAERGARSPKCGARAFRAEGPGQPLLRRAVAMPLMVSWMLRRVSSSSSPPRRRRSISTCRWCSGSR